MEKIIGFLKVRLAPIDECILHTANVESHNYSNEDWIGEAISKSQEYIEMSTVSIVV